MAVSEINEKRRQFTEAVVEGVSAGIVGLDAFGGITLVNARAAEMLGTDEITPIGKRLGEVIPALAPTFERAQVVAARPDARPDRDRLGPGLPDLPGPDHARRHDDREQGVRRHARRHHRPALGAAHRRLGRRRAPHRARDQEPADPDPARRRAPAPALCLKARGRFRGLRQVDQHHPPPGQRHRTHGRRVLVLRADARGEPPARQPQRDHPPGGVPRERAAARDRGDDEPAERADRSPTTIRGWSRRCSPTSSRTRSRRSRGSASTPSRIRRSSSRPRSRATLVRHRGLRQRPGLAKRKPAAAARTLYDDTREGHGAGPRDRRQDHRTARRHRGTDRRRTRCAWPRRRQLRLHPAASTAERGADAAPETNAEAPGGADASGETEEGPPVGGGRN